MNSTVTNEDNMDLLRRTPDNYYTLSIVDPPYGIGEDGGKAASRNKPHSSQRGLKGSPPVQRATYVSGGWDNTAPAFEFFQELRRVSKNQIIWGANHFISRIPFDSSCWVIWDKMNGASDFADCELAWTSFKTAVRKFEWKWNGMLQQDMANKEKRIHPTQKPVALYRWLLQNYAKPGDKILDPFLGSGSSRIAAYDMGFDFTACEKDLDYFTAQEERFKAHIAKPGLFAPAEMYSPAQTKIFTE